jgi:hypothetical protein
MVERGVGTVDGTYEHSLYFKFKPEEGPKAFTLPSSPGLNTHHAGPCTVPVELSGLTLKHPQAPYSETRLLRRMTVYLCHLQ